MKATRVAIVTHNLESAGGTRTLTSFLSRVLQDAPGFIPEIVSLATSARDEASVLVRRPGSWARGIRIEAGHWRGLPHRHVGATAAELEFQRYRPRGPLTELLNGYDLVQFAVGAPPWAAAAENVERPVLLWTATTTRPDRESRLRESSPLRRLWTGAMTEVVERMERRALQQVDTVFALSEYTRRSVEGLVRDRPLLLAPCGVDTQLFQPSASPSADFLLGVARFHDPRKNLPLLLRAYARLRESAHSVPGLWLVGEEPPRAARELLRNLGIADFVKFLGVLPRAELVEVFRNARMFVLSSDEEGLGIPVLEAMASGVPVVSTACGGPETAITHGETGLLVPVGEVEPLAAAMAALLADERLSQRIRKQAREEVERRFSLEAAGRVFLDRYAEIGVAPASASASGSAPAQALASASGPAPTPARSPRDRPLLAARRSPRVLPISVIVPFYDGHETIQRVVDSINHQTMRPSEIVVVDDGSSVPFSAGDVTSEVPIRVIRHETNRGIAAARNTGIREAGEEWLAFIDHDDEWTMDKLQRQWRLAAAERDLANVAFYGRCIWVEPAVEKEEIFPGPAAVEILRRGGEAGLVDLLRRGLGVPFITLLVHRSLFARHGYLDEEIRGGSDDYEFVLRLAAEGVRFVTSDFDGAPRFSARYHMGSRNFSRATQFLSDESIFLQRMGRESPHLMPHVRKALARGHFRAGRIHEWRGDRAAAREQFYRTIALDRGSLRAWLALLSLPASRRLKQVLEAIWRRGRGIQERVALLIYSLQRRFQRPSPLKAPDESLSMPKGSPRAPR